MQDERDEYESAWEADDKPSDGPTEVVADEPVEEDSSESETEPEVDYKALYEAEQHRLKSTEGRYRSELNRMWEAAKQGKVYIPPDEMQGQPAYFAQPGYTLPQQQDPDDAFLTKFRQDYSDDVVKAIDLVARRRAQELVTQTLEKYVAPLQSSQHEIAATAHFSAIEAAHPDAYQIADDPTFNAWLESRPDHLRETYFRVRDSGTPREVISMLNEYKETRHPKATTASPKQVAAASAVKRSRGGLPSTGAPPPEDEFAAAWAAAPE
jgi:hypothetical protein